MNKLFNKHSDKIFTIDGSFPGDNEERDEYKLIAIEENYIGLKTQLHTTFGDLKSEVYIPYTPISKINVHEAFDDFEKKTVVNLCFTEIK